MVIHFQNWFSNVYMSESEKAMAENIHRAHSIHSTAKKRATRWKGNKNIGQSAYVCSHFFPTYYHMCYTFFFCVSVCFVFGFRLTHLRPKNAHKKFAKKQKNRPIFIFIVAFGFIVIIAVEYRNDIKQFVYKHVHLSIWSGSVRFSGRCAVLLHKRVHLFQTAFDWAAGHRANISGILCECGANRKSNTAQFKQ